MAGDYQKARKIGQKQVDRDRARGGEPFPPALDDLASSALITSEVPMGVIEVPLPLVTGTRTRGRQNSFSRGWMPLPEDGSEFSLKWERLYQAHLSKGIREPIKAYEYLHRFYVQEGNKRVSVLSFVDAPTVLADVTRIVPPPQDTVKSRLYQEFLAFYAVCPLYDLDFNREGSYQRLAEHLGLDLTSPIAYVRGNHDQRYENDPPGGTDLHLHVERFCTATPTSTTRACPACASTPVAPRSSTPLGTSWSRCSSPTSRNAVWHLPCKQPKKRTSLTPHSATIKRCHGHPDWQPGPSARERGNAHEQVHRP